MAIYELNWYPTSHILLCADCKLFLIWTMLPFRWEWKNFNEANSRSFQTCRLIKYWHREGVARWQVRLKLRGRKSIWLIINKMRRWKLPTHRRRLNFSSNFYNLCIKISQQNSSSNSHFIDPFFYKNSLVNNKNVIKKAFCAQMEKISPRSHSKV